MKLVKLLTVAVLVTAAMSVQHAAALPPTAGVQAASRTDVVEFNVYLPLRNQQQLETLLAQLHDTKSPKYQQWLKPAEFIERFGPTELDLARVHASLISMASPSPTATRTACTCAGQPARYPARLAWL